MKLVWSARAMSDLREIGDFIAKDSPENARNFVQKLIERTKQATRFPESGRIVPEFRDEKIREFIEGNYRIVYLVNSKDKSLTVLTVFESHALISNGLK